MFICVPEPSFQGSAEVMFDDELVAFENHVLWVLSARRKGRTPTLAQYVAWQGFEASLASLGLYYAAELRHRGQRHHMSEIKECWGHYRKPRRHIPVPPWFGQDKVHDSHKAHLIKTNKEYKKVWPDISTKLKLRHG